MAVGSRILIGTASWTDPGFVADWYPPKLPSSKRLRWYAEHFNFVEVNATFYALPQAKIVERWCNETPDDFVFDVKLPKVLSRHAMGANFLPLDLRASVPQRAGRIELTPRSQELIARRFLREIEPLREARKLGALLLQLGPAFRPKDHQLGELDSALGMLSAMISARRVMVVHIASEPRLDPLRRDPRFERLVRRVRLVSR